MWKLISAENRPLKVSGAGPAPFCSAILLPVFGPQSLIRFWSMTDSVKPLICRECGKLMEFLGETPTTAAQPAAQIYRCISCDRYRRFSTKIGARVRTAPGRSLKLRRGFGRAFLLRAISVKRMRQENADAR